VKQQPLFVLAPDERLLPDSQRTALEAIDKLGSIDVRTAGRIVYRLRGYVTTVGIPHARLLSDGYRILLRLQKLGFVRRLHDDRWTRR
jgi:hypothetical protein